MTTTSPPPDEEEDDEEEEEENNGVGGGEVSTTNTKMRCKDCGNQAKRECQHSRCRTCCKSHGFNCPTHVKSTWVPVSDRRPRPLTRRHHFFSPNPKRFCCNQNPPLLGCERGGNFPAEVSVPAVFRCVRVSAMDEGVIQYAYQTSVRIGGRIFTGVLYDQGAADLPDGSYMAAGIGGGGGGRGIELFQNPNLGNGGGGTISTAGGTTPLFPYVIGLTGAAHVLFQYPKY